MPDRVSKKWRPSLVLVLGGALCVVLVLPLAGLLALREMQDALGFRQSALLVAAVVGLVTLGLGFLLWRLLLVPIRALAGRAAAVQQGAPAGALPHYGTAELGALGRSVLAMARSLQDREATIRHFSDHATHELKAPLSAIKGAAELLGDTPSDPRLIGTIEAAVARMEAQLQALQRVTAAREPMYHGTASLQSVVDNLRPASPLTIISNTAQVPIAEAGLTLVLGHLLTNAVQQGATVVEITATKGVEGVTIDVIDNGSGISDGNRARIFEPFFTTRRAAGGTGMGLAIVRGLLAAHGAEILLEPGHPTRFKIVFPDT